MEVGGEERDDELEGGREGCEEHLFGFEALVGETRDQVLEESQAVTNLGLGWGGERERERERSTLTPTHSLTHSHSHTLLQ